MTRRKVRPKPCDPTTGRNSYTLARPSRSTPAQAMAVFELLDDLRELIWRGYGRQIQEVLRKESTDITAPIPGNIDDGEVPF